MADSGAGTGADADDEADVCFICANPVAHHSIAPCNHATCHICGLRMRALYKTKDCAHCRVSTATLNKTYPPGAPNGLLSKPCLDPSPLRHLHR
jgi:hypothetical protein